MMAKTTTEDTSGAWAGFFVLGILLVILGFAVMIFPVAGTFAVELLFGLVLLFAGLTQIVLAFRAQGWGGFIVSMIIGILYVLVGLLFLFNPFGGAITLTLILGAFLLVDGILRIVLSFQLKNNSNWVWIFFEGIITGLIGIFILLSWPSDSLWVIGFLFGISILFSGLTSMVVSFMLKDNKDLY